MRPWWVLPGHQVQALVRNLPHQSPPRHWTIAPHPDDRFLFRIALNIPMWNSHNIHHIHRDLVIWSSYWPHQAACRPSWIFQLAAQVLQLSIRSSLAPGCSGPWGKEIQNCPTRDRLMGDPPHSILVLVVPHPQGLERLKWVGYKTLKVTKVAWLQNRLQVSFVRIKKLPGHMWSCQGWWRSSQPRGCRATWCPQSWWTQTSTKKWE